MANILKSFLEQGRDTDGSQVADFFPKLIDTLTQSVADGENASVDELMRKAAIAPDGKPRMLRAKFIVCPTEEYLKRSGIKLAQAYALRIEHGLKQYFSDFLGFSVDFSVYYCSQPAKGAEALAFDVFEDIKAVDGLEAELIKANGVFRSRTNSDVIDRGLKVLVIQTDKGQHSSAQQGGMYAYLNEAHLAPYQNDFQQMRKQSYERFDITLVHEVCHLFGLSDRYQFVQNYVKKENCHIMQGGRQLVPIAVSPDIDPDANTREMALNNLMYGADDWSRALTQYQRDVILGIAGPQKDRDQEPSYNQMTFLVPLGHTLYTAGEYIKKTGYETIDANVRTILMGVSPNGQVFMYVSKEGKLVPDDSGAFVFLDGVALGDRLHKEIGILVQDPDHNLLEESSNKLGLEILNSPDCDDPKLKKENDKNYKKGSSGR
jgi:hypothetical protein